MVLYAGQCSDTVSPLNPDVVRPILSLSYTVLGQMWFGIRYMYDLLCNSRNIQTKQGLGQCSIHKQLTFLKQNTGIVISGKTNSFSSI